jgi:hypothetical protein
MGEEVVPPNPIGLYWIVRFHKLECLDNRARDEIGGEGV